MTALSLTPVIKTRITAVVEVVLVTTGIFLIINLLSRTPLPAWQRETFFYVFHGHLLFMVLPVVWLLLNGRALAAYGITLRHMRSDVAAALTCFLPLAVAGGALGFLAYTQWHGALIAAAIQVGVLFWVARVLRGKPEPQSGVLTIVLALLMFGAYSWWRGLFPGLGRGVASFIYYFIFIGFGEEILYRGFILSRLNEAFGRPWQFYDVRWGWGAVLAALIFGFTHVLNDVDTLLWWWGLWTFFGALVFTYVREKTGSIVAPAIIHGLPQALVYLLIVSL